MRFRFSKRAGDFGAILGVVVGAKPGKASIEIPDDQPIEGHSVGEPSAHPRLARLREHLVLHAELEGLRGLLPAATSDALRAFYEIVVVHRAEAVSAGSHGLSARGKGWAGDRRSAYGFLSGGRGAGTCQQNDQYRRKASRHRSPTL